MEIKVNYNLWARQSGKTSYAVYEWLKDPDNSLLVVINNDWVRRLESDLRIPPHKNIINIDQLFSHGRPLVTKIIFDEFDSFTTKQQQLIYHEYPRWFTPKSDGELIIFTTGRSVINRSVFEIVRLLKNTNGLHYSDALDYCKKFGLIKEEQEFAKLYYSFLTSPNVTITRKMPFNKNLISAEQECRMGEVAFSVEILNNPFIEHSSIRL